MLARRERRQAQLADRKASRKSSSTGNKSPPTQSPPPADPTIESLVRQMTAFEAFCVRRSAELMQGLQNLEPSHPGSEHPALTLIAKSLTEAPGMYNHPPPQTQLAIAKSLVTQDPSSQAAAALHLRVQEVMATEWEAMGEPMRMTWATITREHNGLERDTGARARFLAMISPTSGYEAWCVQKTQEGHAAGCIEDGTEVDTVRLTAVLWLNANAFDSAWKACGVECLYMDLADGTSTKLMSNLRSVWARVTKDERDEWLNAAIRGCHEQLRLWRQFNRETTGPACLAVKGASLFESARAGWATDRESSAKWWKAGMTLDTCFKAFEQRERANQTKWQNEHPDESDPLDKVLRPGADKEASTSHAVSASRMAAKGEKAKWTSAVAATELAQKESEESVRMAKRRLEEVEGSSVRDGVAQEEEELLAECRIAAEKFARQKAEETAKREPSDKARAAKRASECASTRMAREHVAFMASAAGVSQTGERVGGCPIFDDPEYDKRYRAEYERVGRELAAGRSIAFQAELREMRARLAASPAATAPPKKKDAEAEAKTRKGVTLLTACQASGGVVAESNKDIAARQAGLSPKSLRKEIATRITEQERDAVEDWKKVFVAWETAHKMQHTLLTYYAVDDAEYAARFGSWFAREVEGYLVRGAKSVQRDALALSRTTERKWPQVDQRALVVKERAIVKREQALTLLQEEHAYDQKIRNLKKAEETASTRAQLLEAKKCVKILVSHICQAKQDFYNLVEAHDLKMTLRNNKEAFNHSSSDDEEADRAKDEEAALYAFEKIEGVVRVVREQQEFKRKRRVNLCVRGAIEGVKARAREEAAHAKAQEAEWAAFGERERKRAESLKRAADRLERDRLAVEAKLEENRRASAWAAVRKLNEEAFKRRERAIAEQKREAERIEIEERPARLAAERKARAEAAAAEEARARAEAQVAAKAKSETRARARAGERAENAARTAMEQQRAKERKERAATQAKVAAKARAEAAAAEWAAQEEAEREEEARRVAEAEAARKAEKKANKEAARAAKEERVAERERQRTARAEDEARYYATQQAAEDKAEAERGKARQSAQAVSEATDELERRLGLAKASTLAAQEVALAHANQERLRQISRQVRERAASPPAAAPSPPPADADTTESNECVICLERPRTHFSNTCAHLTLCATCAPTQTKCPFCRADTTFRQLFVV
jgi:hypothetical protein